MKLLGKIPFRFRKYLSDLYRGGGAGKLAATAFAETYIAAIKTFGVKPFADVNPVIVVSRRYRFIYIGLPKTGTQSFLKTFYEDAKTRTDFDIELIESFPTVHNAFAKYPNFRGITFVRNPWARALSCYQSKIADPDPVKRARILSLYKGLKPGMGFTEFTRWLCGPEGVDAIADRHWLSQHVFLSDEHGKLRDIRHGRFETMEEDFKAFLSDCGAPDIALKTGGFFSGSQDYAAHYDDEAKENIAQRYARDIQLFGYRFES